MTQTPVEYIPAPLMPPNLGVPLDAPAANVPIFLSPTLIDIQVGFNPRKFFNPRKYQELLASVRQHGVYQNIVVRPRQDILGRYWVVAGERRWRAASEAGLLHIPALVLDLTDEQALAIAVSENLDRDDLSPAEEALAAQRMMQLTQGDRQEAAKRLRWSIGTLDSRLLLCQASEAVLMALAEEKIFLGHAELLSPLPEATQNGTLTEIIQRKITVQELRTKLDAFALDLATAVFDKTACQTCRHNTTRQASLFEQHVGEGRCTNRPCFHSKTVEHLQELRVGLRDEHNAVFLDTERTPDTWALLLKREVGGEQFDQGCKPCAHFGCLISTRFGEAGTLTRDVCFNLTCRAEKISAHQATLKSLEAHGARDSATPDTRTTQPKNKQASGNKAPKAAALPTRVIELIHAIHRRAAAAEVSSNPHMTLVYAVLALLDELGLMFTGDGTEDPLTRRGIQRGGSNTRTLLIGTLYALPNTELTAISAELAGRLSLRTQAGDIYLKGAQATLRALNVDLTRHFCVDATFLKAHTKDGIESLLTDAGFATFYNTQKNDQRAFKKLMSARHPEIVEAILKSGFDFKGFVPKSVRVSAK